MSRLLNEGLCKQLVAEFFRRTSGGSEKRAVVLRELMQITYSQGFAAGSATVLSAAQEVEPYNTMISKAVMAQLYVSPGIPLSHELGRLQAYDAAAITATAQPAPLDSASVDTPELRKLTAAYRDTGLSRLRAPWAALISYVESLIDARVAGLRKDAERYRWLRDKSAPGICTFYLSVGAAFMGVKFAPKTVDEAIDAQIAAAPALVAANGGDA